MKFPDMSINQRISVTPDRTAENRYFDPVRGGWYTNGSSSSRSRSIQSPRYGTDQVRVTKKTAKTHKTPREFSGGAAENLSMDSAPQNGAENMQLPPMGSFPPSPSDGIRKPPRTSVGGIRRPRIGASSSRYPIQGGSTSSIPADRPYFVAGGLSAAGSGGQKSGTGKRSTLRRATSSSLEPTSQPSVGGAFVGPEPEPHDGATRKKQKTTAPVPRVYANPYMNPIRFCAGTFTNPRRASRDPSIPEPSNPYTKRRYDQLVASQVEESPDDLLAVEAAGQLMELQRRDYDRDFAQRMNSAPKRRRSN